MIAFSPFQQEINFCGFDAIKRQQNRNDEMKSLIACDGTREAGDFTRDYYFIEKGAAFLPFFDAVKHINLYFFGRAENSKSPHTITSGLLFRDGTKRAFL